jgi:peptidoglycan/LPS O-acetylase OafA/YrhL
MGVVLFFVLSGFLIGGQIMEEVDRENFSFYRFYLKRFWRIFPPYYFSILVISVIYFTGLPYTSVILPGTGMGEFMMDVFYHVFYLQNYISSPKLQSIYWSLGVEEQFYIVIPLLLFFISTRARRGLTIFLVVVAAVDIAVSLYLLYNYRHGFDLSTPPFYTYFSTIVFGVLAARIFMSQGQRLTRPGVLRKLVLIVAALGLAVSFFLGGEVEDNAGFWWSIPVTGLSFAALMLWATTYGLGRDMRLNRFFSLVARLSYSMYLYHVMLILPVKYLVSSYWTPNSFFDFLFVFALYFTAVVALSAFFYRLIDMPCMDYRKRVLARMAGGG